MAMKKIKPQYGKVIPPSVNVPEESEVPISEEIEALKPKEIAIVTENTIVKPKEKATKVKSTLQTENTVSKITADPNPFLQSKEVFNKANLTKIGYRMRTEYVEILDILKKLKKGGYTLEAVLDDALTYYFDNSEDGQDALKKAELFYS
jgi:hypothetical protein